MTRCSVLSVQDYFSR